MKNLIYYLIVCSLFLFNSCGDKEDDVIQRNGKSEKILVPKTELLLFSDSCTTTTRSNISYQVQSFTGETNLIVGKAYTYVVKLDHMLYNTPVLIRTSNSSAVRIAYGNTYVKEHILYVTGAEFTFQVLVINEANDLSLDIRNYDSKDPSFAGIITGVNAKLPELKINAPSYVIMDSFFFVECPFNSAPNTQIKTYWKSSFKVLDNLEDNKNKHSLRLEANVNPGKYSVSIEMRCICKTDFGEFEFLVGKATSQIQVGMPFQIKNVPNTGSDFNKTFEITGTESVVDAKITWTSENGLTLISGQNTNKATFAPVNGYQGYSRVKASVKLNGYTYDLVSEKMWLGLPKIICPETNFEITWRHKKLNLTANIEGSEAVNWNILSGSLSYVPLDFTTGICVTSSLSYDQSENAIIELSAVNSCGRSVQKIQVQVKKTPLVRSDQWILGFPEISGNQLSYDIVYKATTDYHLSSLYLTCLYNGAYDGAYNSETWDWKYDTNMGIYLPPQVESIYGSVNKVIDVLNASSTKLIISAGTTYTCRIIHPIESGKQLKDIEYLFFHLYDNKKQFRYFDLFDFKDFINFNSM